MTETSSSEIGSIEKPRTIDYQQGLVAQIVIASLLAYPLLGTLVAFFDYSSYLASIPVRLYVTICSLILIAGRESREDNILVKILYFYFAIYFIRLFVDLLNSDLPDSEINFIYFFATCLVPAFAAAGYKNTELNEFIVAKWLVVIGTTTCLLAVFPEFMDYNINKSLTLETGRLSYETVNPITYGHVAATVIIGGLIMLKQTSSLYIKVALIVSIIIAGIVLNLSASRGPLLALIVCLALYLFYMRSGKIFLFLFFGAIVILFAIFANGEINLWNRLMIVEDDPSTFERIEFQMNALEQFFQNPILGSAHVELNSLSYPHNLIVESGMAMGVYGLLIFVILFFAMIYCILAQLRNGDTLMPLLGVQYLVGAQFSGSLFQSGGMWIIMVIIFNRQSSNAMLTKTNKNSLIF